MNKVDIFSQGTHNKNSKKNRININNKTKKILAGGTIGLIAWQALSVIEPTDNIIPSPVQIVDVATGIISSATGAVSDAANAISERSEDIQEDNSKSANNSSAIPSTEVPESSQATILTQTTTTISQSVTLPPVNVTTGNTTSAQVAPNPETTLSQIESQIVFVSGSISCSETVVAVFTTQTTDSGETRIDYPVEAMSEASGQDMDKLVPSQADQLWTDTQFILNGGEVERAEGVTFISPANCSGLEILPQ